MARQARTFVGSRPALSSLTGFLLRRAYAMTMDCARSSLDADANIRDASILLILEERGPMSQRAAADLLQINRTIMVKLVDALESEGYLVRERNPADRRAYALTVTAAGRRRRAELMAEFDTAEATLTGRLSAAQRTRLNKRLRQLLDDDAPVAFPSLDEYTGYLITLAHQQQLQVAQRRLEPLELQPRDFGVLSVIDTADPCSQQHIADVLGVSAPVVLWLIDDLEHNGLVLRTRNAADRRSYDLELTDEGRERLDRASSVVAEIQAGVVDRLGARGDGELRTLLTTIVSGDRNGS